MEKYQVFLICLPVADVLVFLKLTIFCQFAIDFHVFNIFFLTHLLGLKITSKYDLICFIGQVLSCQFCFKMSCLQYQFCIPVIIYGVIGVLISFLASQLQGSVFQVRL